MTSILLLIFAIACFLFIIYYSIYQHHLINELGETIVSLTITIKDLDDKFYDIVKQ